MLEYSVNSRNIQEYSKQINTQQNPTGWGVKFISFLSTNQLFESTNVSNFQTSPIRSADFISHGHRSPLT